MHQKSAVSRTTVVITVAEATAETVVDVATAETVAADAVTAAEADSVAVQAGRVPGRVKAPEITVKGAQNNVNAEKS